MTNKIVIGDADSLIALAYKEDIHHGKFWKISETLFEKGYQIIYPNTAIVEAITTLKRALNSPRQAHLLNKQYLAGAFIVAYVDKEVQQRASEIFEAKAVSKKNTLFDAIVAATAEKLGADVIFSFDSWYPKLGLKLVGK